jgi:transposase-like protein
MRDSVKYSEAFKLQVVREMEEGRHQSCYAASQFYGIGGTMTVQRWVRSYGKNHLIGKVVRVEKPGERSELKKLRERVSELEAALADTTLDLRLEQAYVKLACRAGGIDDVDEFKKKHAGTRPTRSEKSTKRSSR